MTGDPNRTYHASQAMQLSELISLKFAPMRFGKAPVRVVRVAEPDGPSTDGGRKARQAMLLAPEKGDGHAIVFGFIDLGRKAAELRSLAAVKQQHEARHHQPLDVTDEEYGKLLGAMRDYLSSQEIKFELLDPPAQRAASGSSAPPGSAVRVRGTSGITAPTAGPDRETSELPKVPIAIGFVAGTLFGFILCYLLLVGR